MALPTRAPSYEGGSKTKLAVGKPAFARSKTSPAPPPLPPGKGDLCLAIYDFSDKAENRLQFVKGEEILLEDLHDGGWAYGESQTTKKTGYFPLQYVTKKQQTRSPPTPTGVPPQNRTTPQQQSTPAAFAAPLPPPLTSVAPSPRPVSSPPNSIPGVASPPPSVMPLPFPVNPNNRRQSSPPLPTGLPLSPTGLPLSPTGLPLSSPKTAPPSSSNATSPVSPSRAISPPFGFLSHKKSGKTSPSPRGSYVSPPRGVSPVKDRPYGGSMRIRTSQSFSVKLDEAGAPPAASFANSSGPKFGAKDKKFPHRRPQSTLDPVNQTGIFYPQPPPGGNYRKARRASAVYPQPVNDFDIEYSIVNNKKQTRTKLDTWLKTKRPDMDELQKRGILSTDGNIEGIQFAKKNIVKTSKKELVGMPLDELLEAVPGRHIPFIVDQCVTYIRRNAMTLHGVFRVSPNQQELQKLKALYKSPLDVIDLEKKVKDPHVVAGLLKLFLSSLPEPLFPCTLYSPLIDSFGRLFDQDNHQPLIDEYKILLKLIPKAHAPLIRFLFEFLEELQRQSEKNMMTPSNLGIVFGPNLLKPSVQTQDSMLNMTNRDVVSFLVTHFHEIWGVG